MTGGRRRILLLGLAWACLVPRALAEPGVDPDLWRQAGVVAIRPPVLSPEIALRNLDRARVGLRDFRDRLVLLYFWTTW